MVLASGNAGDCPINDTSIYHTNTPNLSDRVRKVIWALYAGALTPIWVQKDLPEDYRDQTRLTKADVGVSDDPVMAALFRNLPED